MNGTEMLDEHWTLTAKQSASSAIYELYSFWTNGRNCAIGRLRKILKCVVDQTARQRGF